MDIKINSNFNIVRPFSLFNLPDFLVVTGENGSGKTQFLASLAFPQEMSSGQEGEKFFSSEILSEGKRMTFIQSIPADGHYFNLGTPFYYESFLNQWEDIKIAYQVYIQLLNSSNGQDVDFDTYHKYLLQVLNSNFNIPNKKDINLQLKITRKQFDLIKDVQKAKNNYNLPTTEDFIIHSKIEPTDLFSTDFNFLLIKHLCLVKQGNKVEKPWEEFNKILREAGFKYILKEPGVMTGNNLVKMDLVDTSKDNIIDLGGLSSGEKTIFWLLLALYNTQTEFSNYPDVILLDEPDAYLHPSMTKQMIDVLQNVFVKRRNIKVIITTHSPTTIALSPDLSLYSMDRSSGSLMKIDKAAAIKLLTKGIDNLNIYYDNRRQIFVESNIDKIFYEHLYSVFKRENLLNQSIGLEFVTTSDKKGNGDSNGGCVFLRSIVNKLIEAGNQSVAGIVDFDLKNTPNDRIKVFGYQKRYSIENYILDPIFIAAFILMQNEDKKVDIGFDKDDYITHFQDFNNTKIQSVIDTICFSLGFELANYEFVDLLNGYKVKIPIGFLQMQGHQLHEKVLSTYYFLNKYCENRNLLKPFIKKVIIVFYMFLPIESTVVFEELENV